MAPGAEQNRTRRRTVMRHDQAVDNRQVIQAVDNSHVQTVDNRQVALAGERAGRGAHSRLFRSNLCPFTLGFMAVRQACTRACLIIVFDYCAPVGQGKTSVPTIATPHDGLLGVTHLLTIPLHAFVISRRGAYFRVGMHVMMVCMVCRYCYGNRNPTRPRAFQRQQQIARRDGKQSVEQAEHCAR